MSRACQGPAEVEKKMAAGAPVAEASSPSRLEHSDPQKAQLTTLPVQDRPWPSPLRSCPLGCLHCGRDRE